MNYEVWKPGLTVDVIIYVGQASGTSKDTIVPKGKWTVFNSFCINLLPYCVVFLSAYFQFILVVNY